jgi:SAM-dependent methyltransferase
VATVGVEPLAGCPACGETQRKRLFVKDGWPIERCAACTLVYVDARLDREAIDQIYRRDYYEGEAFADYLGERRERLESARDRVRRLASVIPGGRLLDLGCATGFFLEAAAASYDVTGVEVSQFAAEFARKEFGHRVFIGEIFDAPLVDEEFDVVTMWDVLEHVRDPRATLDEVARVTRTGGVLVLSTGNVEGPLARRDLEHWDLMFPPGHLTFFSPQSLEPLLNAAGFELDRIIGDGRVSRRAGLTRPYSVAAAGAIGLGNVITVTARRARVAERPRRRLLKARVPSELLRSLPRPRRRPSTPADSATWLEISRRCSYATFFHTPMWRELAVASGCRDSTFMLTLPSGVRAVFPLQELLPRHGPGRYLLSTYPYGFGGPIADGTLSADEIRSLYDRARAATTVVTGNPLAPDPPNLRRWTRQMATTQLLDLELGYEELQRHFSKGHRAAITQAVRNGITTRVATSLDDYRRYYEIYEDSLRRWGDAASPRYPWSLFEVCLRLANEHPEAVRLWVAEHNGDIVAGALIFSWNGHVMYWHAANLEQALELRVSNLLLANAIEDSCERGCRWFDFAAGMRGQRPSNDASALPSDH